MLSDLQGSMYNKQKLVQQCLCHQSNPTMDAHNNNKKKLLLATSTEMQCKTSATLQLRSLAEGEPAASDTQGALSLMPPSMLPLPLSPPKAAGHGSAAALDDVHTYMGARIQNAPDFTGRQGAFLFTLISPLFFCSVHAERERDVEKSAQARIAIAVAWMHAAAVVRHPGAGRKDKGRGGRFLGDIT